MGEDIDNCPYSSILECVACGEDLFAGRTPQYILATVTGVEKCPFASAGPANGSFLMTQDPDVECTWRYVDGTVSATLEEDDGVSHFVLTAHVGLRRIFFTGAAGGCSDVFENTFQGCDFVQGGFGGTARMTWGCSIRP